MPTEGTTQSPNDALAELVARELVDAGLIPNDSQTELEAKLKSGGASQDDWTRWIDAATAPSEHEGGSREQANHQD